MWIGWLIVVFILTIIEVATVSLVSVWFIASAILALAVSFLIDSFFIQFAVFVIGGLIFLVITKPSLEKFLKKNEHKTNLDRIIGMQGKVTEPIKPHEIGEVYVDGKRWSAYSDEEIGVDEMVTILAINGVKLQVRKE